MLRLGVIGRRGQAALWTQAASKTRGWKPILCYHPQMGLSSWKKLLCESDAVVIASPTSTHLNYLRRLSRDYPGIVLVEKPIVASLKECRALLREAPPFFLKRVYVAHNWRFYPWVKKIREILRRDSGTPVLSAYFQLTHDYGFKPGYASSWRSQKKSHPIGPAETQGIHWVDLVHDLCGPIDWISGGAERVGRVGSAPDTASIFLRTRSGVFCSIHTSYVAPAAYFARVVTSRMILTYRDGILQIQKQPPARTDRPSRPAACRTLLSCSLGGLLLQPLVFQLKKLGQLLAGRRGRGELVTVREGIANVAALEGFARSLRRGKPYALKGLPLYVKSVKLKTQ